MAVKMGSGRFAYEVLVDWAKVPEGWSFLEVVDVAVDEKDRVYIFSRGEHPVTIFDSEGNLLNAWGTRDRGMNPISSLRPMGWRPIPREIFTWEKSPGASSEAN